MTTPSTADTSAIRQEILDYCLLSMQYGLNFNTQGNISVILRDEQKIIITPTDIGYEKMTVDDMVVVDLDGRFLEGAHPASSEVDVHAAVYRRRPDVTAIVHTEPIYTNVFGVLGRPIDGVLINMVLYTKGAVPIMPFAPSNSAEFGDAMCDVMGETNAVVWANHGLLTVADNLRDAFKTSVAVESAAKVLLAALGLDPSPTILRYEDVVGSDSVGEGSDFI